MFIALILSFIFLRLSNTFKIAGLCLLVFSFVMGFIMIKLDNKE